MVDEELVQVRERADPSDAEEPGRRARSDPRNEPPELSVVRQPHPASLGEPLERARKEDAGAREEIALTQHEVGGEVARSPALDQRGYVSPELFEEIAKRKALLRVERKTTHPAGQYLGVRPKL